ncbi:MAG: group III truncated hemoglobin [Hyphomicrobium sp.]|jgi:hemoglobin
MDAPHPKSPGLAAGVTEPMIRDLVHTFYAKARLDPLLGPIFNAKVHDWDTHLATLCRFWSSVTLLTGTYKGRPMVAHAALPEIDDPHFARWLTLFEETAIAICPPAAAHLFIDRSQRIAYSLKQGIDIQRGRGPASGLGTP